MAGEKLQRRTLLGEVTGFTTTVGLIWRCFTVLSWSCFAVAVAVRGIVGSVKQAAWAPTAFGRSELLEADRILGLNCFCGRAV